MSNSFVFHLCTLFAIDIALCTLVKSEDGSLPQEKEAITCKASEFRDKFDVNMVKYDVVNYSNEEAKCIDFTITDKGSENKFQIYEKALTVADCIEINKNAKSEHILLPKLINLIAHCLSPENESYLIQFTVEHSKYLQINILYEPDQWTSIKFALTIPAKEMNEIDLLKLRLKEAEDKIKELNAQCTLSLNTFTQRLQRLENPSKMEEIDLNLENQWVNYGGSWQVAKASKIGNIVYLKGLVKSGQSSTKIATLPQGWRPSKWRMFGQAQNGNKACRVDINPNGEITLNGQYSSWVTLDGIQFVAN